jgi:chaperonin GroES
MDYWHSSGRLLKKFSAPLELDFFRSQFDFCSAGGTGPSLVTSLICKEDCMQFRPLHDRVVVRRLDAEEKTAGGIIIPDTAKEKPSQGEVVAVGPGGRDEAGKLIPIDLKAGDTVLFGKWSGTEVKIDGKDLLIMKESDILGVIENTAVFKKAA